MKKVPVNGPTIKGIDVSHHNGQIDFKKVKADGFEFVFIKATEGTGYVDVMYHTNKSAALAAGLLVGSYHFFHPSQDPLTQARAFAHVVGPLGPNDLPCVLDWESTDGVPVLRDVMNGETFLNSVAMLTNKQPIIYCGPYFGQDLSLGSKFKAYPLWICHYLTNAPLIPGPWDKWTFWQNSEQGRADGISGHGVDTNLFQGSMDDLRTLCKFIS